MDHGNLETHAIFSAAFTNSNNTLKEFNVGWIKRADTFVGRQGEAMTGR